jgi:hypothetical protein
MNVLEDFASEGGIEEQAHPLASWRAAEPAQEPWPAYVLDAMREDIADAVRTLRVEQRVLFQDLTDALIKWTVGTGIAVAALVIAALKLL